VLEIQLRGLHFIDGTGVVPLADDALIPRPLRALQLTFRGVDRHLGKVGMLLAREDLPADLDLLTRELGIDAVERRLLALQLVGELRALEGREHLSFVYAVPGANLVAHGPRGDRKERWAHCSHHRALRRDITHEVTTGHRREAQAFAADHLSGAEPAFHGERQDEEQEAGGGRERCALPPPWRDVRRTRCILSLGAADPGAARGSGN